MSLHSKHFPNLPVFMLDWLAFEAIIVILTILMHQLSFILTLLLFFFILKISLVFYHPNSP
jgi:hypothetical protein